MSQTQERFVTPRVYHIGYTEINQPGLMAYLQDSDNEEFAVSIVEAREQGLSSAEILCSFYAKLCYRSLSAGHNLNITKTRDIWDNVVATLDSAHGAVFEHVSFNFVVDQCSRVFTHEWVRHRIGVAHSQTSGRYCRYDFIPRVFDPCLEPVRELWEQHLKSVEDTLYLTECELGLRVPPDPNHPVSADMTCFWRRNQAKDWEKHLWVPNPAMPFHQKKKLTSACRRIIPQGIVNEMGMSLNLRALRHVIQIRTAAGAEWEIREVFGQVYRSIKDKYPLVFYGAKERMVDGALEVYGLRQQPYELTEEQVLASMELHEIEAYLERRKQPDYQQSP